MPLLFSLAIHETLAEAQRDCGPQEHLFAFLDDVYATSDVPNRTRTLYDSLGTKLHAQAGFACTLGRQECGIERPCVPKEWRSGTRSVEPRRRENLGNTCGFVQEVVERRLAEEQRLWDAVPNVPDLQAACAGPRCHHVLPTLLPSQSEVYARGHDLGMERMMSTLLALPGDRQRPSGQTAFGQPVQPV